MNNFKNADANTHTESVKMPSKVVLLDLDGTLTKSDEGIFASVRETYSQLNREVPPQSTLDKFIGPPLFDSFKANGFPNDAEADHAVQVFRSTYIYPFFDDPINSGEKIPGKFICEVFPGIPQALTQLRNDGYTLAVATCKPQSEANSVCAHFGLTDYVDAVYGASEGNDKSRLHKDQVILHACKELPVNFENGDQAIMVGDRWTDFDGAHETGLKVIACGWGFAEPGEFEEHNVDYVAQTISDLPNIVNSHFAQ